MKSLTKMQKNYNPPVQVGSKQKVYKFIFILGFIISLSLLAVIMYRSYKYSYLPKDINDIPIIRADMTSIKVAPIDPGGAHFSNQDKLIYSSLEDKNLTINKENNEEIKAIKDVYNDISDIRMPPINSSNNSHSKPARTEVNKVTEQKTNNSDRKKDISKKNSEIKNNPFELLENDG